MVEEDEFRDAYRAVNARRCVFEKSVLARQCDCHHARRFWLADREGVGCGSAEAGRRCEVLLEALRRKARFALRQSAAISGPLPHAKEVKVQSGGLRGLRALIQPEREAATPVEDVAALTSALERRFGDIERLPYDRVMPHVVHYRGRRAARRKHREE